VDGKQYRRETKEERQERLRLQEEAREKCFNCVMPVAGGVLVILMFVFAMYVRSVPPRTPTLQVNPEPQFTDDPAFQQAFQEAQEALKKAQEGPEKEEDTVVLEEADSVAADETIEL